MLENNTVTEAEVHGISVLDLQETAAIEGPLDGQCVSLISVATGG